MVNVILHVLEGTLKIIKIIHVNNVQILAFLVLVKLIVKNVKMDL